MAWTSSIMLEEMRHAFDTAHASVIKYSNKTFMVLGGELALILFYMANDEISLLLNLFQDPISSWCIFAVVAAVAFIVAATLFILTLATDRHWMFPPADDRLLYKKQFNKLSDTELENELIEEYEESIEQCVKKSIA